MSVSDRRNYAAYDVNGRQVNMSEMDMEATRRFGNQANTLFGAEAARMFATPIEMVKRAAAKKEVDKIRPYKNTVALGVGLGLAYATYNNYGSLPLSFVVGAISAFVSVLAFPRALNKVEDLLTAATQVETRVALKVA
jgi:hypothetical protein